MSRDFDLLRELQVDLNYLNGNFDEENEDDGRIMARKERVNRMKPFYECRMDIFTEFFDDFQLIQSFRFNRVGILYITGK